LHSFRSCEIILVKIETEMTKGPLMKMTKKEILKKEFVRKVRALVFCEYVEYFETNLGEKLTFPEHDRLLRGMSLAFVTEAVAGRIEDGFDTGSTPETVAKCVFTMGEVRREVKAIWGFKKKYELASMYSRASYACSPDSEAYWSM